MTDLPCHCWLGSPAERTCPRHGSAEDQQAAREAWYHEVIRDIDRLGIILRRLEGVAHAIAFRDANPAPMATLCGDASELLCTLEAQSKGPQTPSDMEFSE